MAKKHKEIIHNTEKTRHERSEYSSFYGSLVVIMFLIVATAMLLMDSGSMNLVGMATRMDYL